ncbi:MAG: ATP-binding protein [Nanoarchaeota archaeon]
MGNFISIDAKKYAADAIHALTGYLSTIKSMAFIASSGNPKYNTPIPTENLDRIVDIFPQNLQKFPEHPPNYISSAQLTALKQLVKNANRYCFPVVFFDTTSHMAVESIEIHVQDNSYGILDRKGQPITAEKLPSIFGEYSTKRRGGFGLQAVKRLMELEGYKKSDGFEVHGFVRVLTTFGDGNSLRYETIDKKARDLGNLRFPKGSEFILISPVTYKSK